MVPRSPSDAIWDALAPLLGQLEAVQGGLDLCVFYLPWCAGGAAGLATLLLTGLVLSEIYGDGDETVRFRFADGNTQP